MEQSARSKNMMPHGFRFNPTDEELIQILDRKASGQETLPLHFILEANVYQLEPQDLEWNQCTALSNGERYYYCRRDTNNSREVSGRGWWKATSHVKKVYSRSGHELLVGNKRPLTFHRFNDNERNRNNAIKTNWIMHEYSLESRTTGWRLCKIKYKGKPSTMQGEMVNIKQHDSLRNDSKASSSTNMEMDSAGEQQCYEHHHHNHPLPTNYSTMPASDYSSINEYQQNHHQRNNMQQLPPSPYDPYPPALTTSGEYYYVYQQEDSEPSEGESFPSLWNWKN